MPRPVKSSRLGKLEDRKLFWACAIVCLLALTALGIAVAAMLRPPAAPAPYSSISVSGTIVCLPHKKSDGPKTAECATGLKAADGRFYALRDGPVLVPIDKFNQHVRVEGVLSSPPADTIYNIAGTIEVGRIQ